MSRPTMLLLLLASAACNEPGPGAVGPEPGVSVALALVGLPVRDTSAQGSYQAWFIDGEGGLFASERFNSTSESGFTVVVRSPIDTPAEVMVTLEPAGDQDPGPSELKFLGGVLRAGVAELDISGYVTPNIPFEVNPGVHILKTFASLGTPDLPQDQDAGLWLMDPTQDTLSGLFYQTFTPVTAGWMYEGWIVRDYGTAQEVWLSYGKFRPDGFRQASSRDETGLGPFSGKADYERALPFDVRVPGDDWIANPLGLSVPGDLALPLDLNGDAEAGVESRWTHIITVEPYEDRREDPWTSTPMFIRPYRNAIGEAPPDSRRDIEFVGDHVPRGTATIQG